MAEIEITKTQETERERIARHASYEIECLLDVLIPMTSDPEQQNDSAIMAIRGMSIRMHDLNSAIMSVLGDPEGKDADDLHKIVFGVKRETVAEAQS